VGFTASISQHGTTRENLAAATPHKFASLRQRIGVWDLGAWLASLPQLLNRLNAVQQSLTFFMVQAMVPSGLIREPEGVIAWLTALCGRPPTPKRRKEIADNVVIDDDFFAVAKRIRTDLAVDYLVGITPSMIAGDDEDDGAYWDFFSSGLGRIGLASSAELRKFAAKSGRPLEAYLGMIIVAQVLALMSPKIEYHDDNGCLFDFNYERVGIIKSLKNLHIDPRCLKAIPVKHRAAALSLVRLLRNYPNS
jgi:hypothetical protein